jgi:ribosomal protein S18 acetylase RimI-like enzyme
MGNSIGNYVSNSKKLEPTVRLMVSTDIPLIAQWIVQVPLWQRYGLTQEGISGRFEKAIAAEELLYTLEIEGQSISGGFAWCSPQGAFGRSPYLRLIGIHPDYANMGLGGKLLAYVERDCLGFADQLFLLVSDFNIEAQKFYRAQGYQHIGTIPAYILPDVAEFIYHKRLVS